MIQQDVSMTARFRLDNRVALITGAGGAFGRAIALGFAEMGARLFLTDLDGERLAETAELARAAGADCATKTGDSGSPDDVSAVLADLDARFGRVDILVNNAGRNPMQGRPEVFPLEIWDDVLRTN